MSAPPVELLLLDVHGVLLSRAWPKLLRRLAIGTEQYPDEVARRWHHELRDVAWRGRIDDAELWRRLTADRGAEDDGRRWREEFERLCRPTAAARALPGWRDRAPVWLLSNHRTHWLRPRLERFGLAGHVDRMLVSDETGLVKPEPAAFGPALRAVSDPRRILFVDDQEVNVEAARRLGIGAVRAAGSGWMEAVRRRLAAGRGPTPADTPEAARNRRTAIPLRRLRRGGTGTGKERIR
jgi:HAD superfamily hydrolase (TIGR01509 family)